jgi:hypothetical protein
MNNSETVMLCRVIKSLCPSQPLDQYSPDAWAIVLDDIGFDEAKEAVRVIYREQGSDQEWIRRIEADDIIRQVKRVRRQRIDKIGDIVPPAGLTQAEERAWLKDTYRRAAIGETIDTNTRGELVAGPRLQLVGRRIEDDQESA